jgi:hypothetical protein
MALDLGSFFFDRFYNVCWAVKNLFDYLSFKSVSVLESSLIEIILLKELSSEFLEGLKISSSHKRIIKSFLVV